MVTKVPYLKGKDPSVRQSSLGGQAFQVQSELENQNFITLAVVTKVQYKTGLLDFRLTRNATASVVTSGDNTGTARIPVDDWGKDLDGNVYGHYRPVHVGDTIAVGFLNGHKGQPIVLGVYPPNGEQYELISPSLNSTGDDTDSYIAETGLAEKHVHHSGQVDYRSGSGAIFKSLNGTSFLVIDDNTATDYSQYYTQYNNIPYATTSKDNNQTPRKETAGNWLLVHEDNPDSLQSDKHLTRFYVNPKGQFDLVWTNNTFEGTSTVLHGEQGGFSLTKYINHKSKNAGLLSPDKKGFEKNPDFNDNAGYVTFDLGKTNSDTISLKSATKKDSKEQATNLEVKPDGVYVNGLNIINSLKNSLPSWINLDGNTIDFSKVKPLNFTGDMIKDKSITAKKLNIDKLSDITPNLGTITSGSFKFNTGIKGEEDEGIDIEGLPSDDPNILTEADKKALQAQLNNLYSRVEIAIDYAKGTGNEYQPLADGEHNLKMLTQDIFLTKGNVRVNRTLIDNEINKLEELLAKYQREWNSALSSIVAETANHSNKIYRGALKPENPKENDIWFQQQDDGTSKIMVYTDGNWDAPANKDIKEVQEQVEALPKNYYQDNTPTGTNYKAGDKWYKPITSSDGTTYYEMYAWDPNTRQWSRMLDTNNNHNYVANSAPADATNGDFWTDSTGKLHQYRNGEWEEVATQGPQGVPGPKGQDGVSGKTIYIHYAYANSSDGSQGFSTAYFDNAIYLGIYTDEFENDSHDYHKYSWSRMRGQDGSSAYEIAKANGFSGTQQQWLTSLKGDKGDQGAPGKNGTDGTNGISTYIWVKYATNSSGSNMSDSPAGATYIGIATGKTSANESSVPTDYKWTKIKGEDGVPGTPGKDGKTTYLHIAYAMSKDGSNGFVLQADVDTNRLVQYQYMGTYADYVTSSSRNPKDYTWVMIYDNTKKRNFIGQPTTPYSVGDTWTQAGATYFCKTERLTGAFNAADWQQQQLTLQSLDSAVREKFEGKGKNLLEVENIIYGKTIKNAFQFKWTRPTTARSKYVLTFKAKGGQVIRNLATDFKPDWHEVKSTATDTVGDWGAQSLYPSIPVSVGDKITVQAEVKDVNLGTNDTYPRIEFWTSDEGARKNFIDSLYLALNPKGQAGVYSKTITIPQKDYSYGYMMAWLAFSSEKSKGASYKIRNIMFEVGDTKHNFTPAVDYAPTKFRTFMADTNSSIYSGSYYVDGVKKGDLGTRNYFDVEVDNNWHDIKVEFESTLANSGYAYIGDQDHTELNPAGIDVFLDVKDVKLTQGEFQDSYDYEADSINSDEVGNLWSVETLQRGSLNNGNVISDDGSYFTPYIPVTSGQVLFGTEFNFQSWDLRNAQAKIELYDSNKNLITYVSPSILVSKRDKETSVYDGYGDINVYGGTNANITLNGASSTDSNGIKTPKNRINNIQDVFRHSDINDSYFAVAYLDIDSLHVKYQTTLRDSGSYQVISKLEYITNNNLIKNSYVVVISSNKNTTWDFSRFYNLLRKWGLPSSYTFDNIKGYPALAFIGKTPDVQPSTSENYAISFSNGQGQTSNLHAYLNNGNITTRSFDIWLWIQSIDDSRIAYVRYSMKPGIPLSDAKFMLTLDKIPKQYSDNPVDISKLAVRTDKEYRGVTINENGLTATAGKTQVVVNSSNGFEIKKSGSDIFHVDTNGNLTMQGNITAGNISGVNFTGDNLNLSGTMNVDGNLRAGNGNVIMTRNGLTIRGGSFNMTDKSGNQTTYLLDDGTFITNKGVFNGDIHGHSIYLSGENASVNFGGKFKLDGSGSGISNTRAELNDTDIKGSTLSLGNSYRTSYTTDVLDGKVVSPINVKYKTGSSTWNYVNASPGVATYNVSQLFNEPLKVTSGKRYNWSIEIGEYNWEPIIEMWTSNISGDRQTKVLNSPTLTSGVNTGSIVIPSGGEYLIANIIHQGSSHRNMDYFTYRNFYIEPANDANTHHAKTDLYSKSNDTVLKVDEFGNLSIGNAFVNKSINSLAQKENLIKKVNLQYPYNNKSWRNYTNFSDLLNDDDGSNNNYLFNYTTDYLGYGKMVPMTVHELVYNSVIAIKSNSDYTLRDYDTIANPAQYTVTSEPSNLNNPMWIYNYDYFNNSNNTNRAMALADANDPNNLTSYPSVNSDISANYNMVPAVHTLGIINAEYPALEHPVWDSTPDRDNIPLEQSKVTFAKGETMIAGVLVQMDNANLHKDQQIVRHRYDTTPSSVIYDNNLLANKPSQGYKIVIAYKYNSSSTTRYLQGGNITFNMAAQDWGVGLNYLYATVKFKPTEAGYIQTIYLQSIQGNTQYKVGAKLFDPFLIYENTNAIRYIGGTTHSLSKVGRTFGGYVASTPRYHDWILNDLDADVAKGITPYKYAPFALVNTATLKDGDLVNIQVPLNYDQATQYAGSTINLGFVGTQGSNNHLDTTKLVVPTKLDSIKDQPLMTGAYTYDFTFTWKDEYKSKFRVGDTGLLVIYYVLSNVPQNARSYLTSAGMNEFSVSVGSPINLVDDDKNENVTEYKTYLDNNGSIYQSYQSNTKDVVQARYNYYGGINFVNLREPYSPTGSYGWSVANDKNSPNTNKQDIWGPYRKTTAWNGLSKRIYLEKGKYTISAYVLIDNPSSSSNYVFNTYIKLNDVGSPSGFNIFQRPSQTISGSSGSSWTLIESKFEITTPGIYAPRFESTVDFSYVISSLYLTNTVASNYEYTAENRDAGAWEGNLINKSKYSASELHLSTSIAQKTHAYSLEKYHESSYVATRSISMDATKGIQFIGSLKNNPFQQPSITYVGKPSHEVYLEEDIAFPWHTINTNDSKVEYVPDWLSANGLWVDEYGDMHGLPRSNYFGVFSRDNTFAFKSPLNSTYGMKKWAFEFNNLGIRNDIGNTINIGKVNFSHGWDWMGDVPAIYTQGDGGHLSGIAFPLSYVVLFMNNSDENNGENKGIALHGDGWRNYVKNGGVEHIDTTIV